MSEQSALESVVCAKMNFESVVKQNPALQTHPLFIIAMDQLQEAIRKLEEKR